MLWLAGLMGLMAVGTVTFIDPQFLRDEDDENVDAVDDAAEPTEDATSFILPADNFEADYDPRGGDDAALLDPPDPESTEAVILIDGSQSGGETRGTVQDDNIRGFEGEDTLVGGDGDDELHGDAGDDVLSGDAGNDTLHGDGGNDAIFGGDEDDILFGHNAEDALYGGAGSDALQGSAGNDHLSGENGEDTLQGGLDDDTLIGGFGSDALFGGWGDDVLSGLMRDANGNDGDDSDFLNGGGGDDSILVGAGDIVTAGDGADEIVLGDWLASGESAQVTDFSPLEDNLVLIWDDSVGSENEPQIQITFDPENEDQSLVMLDGAVVATVNGNDLLPSDIALIPLSTATHLGLAAS
ncbi:calcium-binding protein [Sulfitobacter donghicola]|uniref:Type I secretion protein n=1 Tax=Sulfitobacter donghicola DSW-25 = KCTC 12864 = JCM 14565 TaxID=1300350 RepID=A0A073IKU7_9RHOB|nr:calcium-binding protein [Sulfitobacter donghicola]KEJ90389.1 type I secretion protein [Sulfitobacter donghicola DSW-25 = KCTC 12864 = JCM 14565]KIN67616.1 Type I secretion target repeat protein [Sulfitobacter donghicola DSW-25 = KCTC 12864 = JCM 14565]